MSEPTVTDPDAPEDSSYDDVLLEGHDYDGIREYDNPIPPWLTLIFVGTIVWSAFYFVAINLGYIDTYHDDLEQGMEALAQARAQAQEDTPEVTSELLAGAVDKDERLSAGKEMFMKNCANCHGQNGEGLVGPNLTDQYWIHGGELMDIYTTLEEGVTENGMPSWNQFPQKDLVNLTAYVRSLQGTDPEGGKKPEGDKFVPGESGG